MKKKLMMVAVLLGALSLGACVDDNESASVTDLRGAKAEQLRALATLNEAKAEAETIRANAEAALLQAQANYEQAKADSMGIYNDKAEQEYALHLEKLQAETQLEILKAQEALKQYQEDVLSNRYAEEVKDLLELQGDLINAQVNAAKAEAGLLSMETSRDVIILEQEALIAGYNAQLAVLQSGDYAALDNSELLVEIATKQEKLDLAEVAFASDPVCVTLTDASAKVESTADLVSEQGSIIAEVNSIKNVVTSADGTGTTPLRYNTYGNVSTKIGSTANSVVFVYENARINASAKLEADREYAKAVEEKTAALGTPNDKADTKYTYTDDSNNEVEELTAYAKKAAAADAKKAAEALKEKFDAIGKDDKLTIDDVEYTKEEGLKKAAEDLETAETKAAEAEDAIAKADAEKQKALADQKEYTDALAALDLTAYNKAVADLKTAIEGVEVAYEAWSKATKTFVEQQAEIDALNFMANNGAIDLDKKIAELQENIADAEAIIAGCEADNLGESFLLDYYNGLAESLELQIKAQQQIVDAAKEALEASINSDEDTPAEETPAA